MEREPHVGLFGFGNHGFEEVLRALHLIGAGVRADVLLRREVLRQLVVVGGVAGAGAADLLLVAFDQAVRVEVVFDDRQARLARRANGSNHVRDLRVGARLAPDDVVEAGDHHVAERDAALRELIDPFTHRRFRPWNARSAAQHVVDADLLHAAQARVVDRLIEAETDLREILVVGWLAIAGDLRGFRGSGCWLPRGRRKRDARLARSPRRRSRRAGFFARCRHHHACGCSSREKAPSYLLRLRRV